MTRLLNKLRWMIERRRREAEIREELAFHVDEEEADGRAAGLTEAQARAAARRDFGNRARVEEDTRAAWGWIWLERFGQDVIYAGRMVRRRPGVHRCCGAVARAGDRCQHGGVQPDARAAVGAPAGAAAPGARSAGRIRPRRLVPGTRSPTRRTTRFAAAARSCPSVIMMTQTSTRAPREIEERGEKSLGLRPDGVGQLLRRARCRRAARSCVPRARAGAAREPIAVISESYWQRHYAGAAVRARRHGFGRAPRVHGGGHGVAGLPRRRRRMCPLTSGFHSSRSCQPTPTSGHRADGCGSWAGSRRAVSIARAVGGEHRARRPSGRPSSPEAPATRRCAGRLSWPLLLVELVVALVLLITCANLANLMLAAPLRASARSPCARRSARRGPGWCVSSSPKASCSLPPAGASRSSLRDG